MSTGETTDTITVINSGLFSLTVTDKQGCILNDSININFTSIINRNEINIFPNPASTNILLSSTIIIKEVELYGLTGSLLRKLVCNKKHQTINISDLSLGNYFIRAISKESYWVEKFVVIK